jgi:hypothetical protein
MADHLTMRYADDRDSCVAVDNHLSIIQNVPLTNATVSRRIEDVTCNIECELMKRIKSS